MAINGKKLKIWVGIALAALTVGGTIVAITMEMASKMPRVEHETDQKNAFDGHDKVHDANSERYDDFRKVQQKVLDGVEQVSEDVSNALKEARRIHEENHPYGNTHTSDDTDDHEENHD